MKENHLIRVAVLGATGIIGQVFVWLLHRHPRFIPAVLCASEKNHGREYGEAVPWQLPFPMDEGIKKIKLGKIDADHFKKKGIRIIFSGLPSPIARRIEGDLRRAGFLIFSNAGAFRDDPEVPIVIPECNPQDLDSIPIQQERYGGSIITNANCSATGLATVLAPLREYQPREIFVSTYQSISGAGYPGLPAMDILHNAIPHIPGEEDKIRRELPKILHQEIAIHATCVRIPVLYGHLESVWVKFRRRLICQDIRRAWEKAQGALKTDIFPQNPVEYIEASDFPQPRLAFGGHPPGMPVYIGRLRREGDAFGFLLLVNNVVKGGAGGSVQNADLYLHRCGGIL